MRCTLEYWLEDGWYIGRLRGIPGVFSQGESLGELEENIKEAYQLMMAEDEPIAHTAVQTKELLVEM